MATNDSPQTWMIRSADDFGRTIADLRSQRGLTQEELARQGGVSRNYLARIETGLTVAMLDRVLRLLRRLGADVTVTAPSPDGDA